MTLSIEELTIALLAELKAVQSGEQTITPQQAERLVDLIDHIDALREPTSDGPVFHKTYLAPETEN